MEAMWTRFQPAVAHLRDLVAAGDIGEVLLVQADFGAQRDFDPASRLFDLALGGGSILDLGVYPISLAQHLMGRPVRVTTTGTTYPNGADRSAAIQMSYDDGRAASLACTLASQTPGGALVVGTEGSIEVVLLLLFWRELNLCRSQIFKKKSITTRNVLSGRPNHSKSTPSHMM